MDSLDFLNNFILKSKSNTIKSVPFLLSKRERQRERRELPAKSVRSLPLVNLPVGLWPKKSLP